MSVKSGQLQTVFTVELDEQLVEHQQVLLDVLARGWIEIGGRAIRSTLFFDGLWMLWSFFDSPKWSRGLSVKTRLPTDADKSRYGGIDGHAPEQRMLLLNSSKSYLADWPESLVTAMHEHRLSSNKLMHFSQVTLSAAPFWLWEAIHLRCDQTSYVPSEGEIKEAIEYVLRRDAQLTISAVCKVLNLKNRYSSRVAYLVLGKSI